MHSLNVLIAGEGKSLQMVKNSRLLNKLYITSDDDVEEAVSIKFNTFKELAKKCKALQVDLVIVENEKWILQGIADVLRKNFINSIAPDSKWAGIIKANKTVKTLLNKYDILTPQVLAFPKKFPLTFKADGFSKIAYSMEELFDIRNEINNYSDELVKTVFLEEYIQGEEISVSSLFDGKSVVSFYQNNLNKNQILCLKNMTNSLN